jgi:hypothetical protein
MNREKSLSKVRNSLVNLDMKGAPKAAKNTRTKNTSSQNS